ncbi:MAG: histidine phosphatase family protein [Chloroflexota bacterium]
MNARRTLYLVRHGQYENTAQDGNEPDGRLTAKGRQQAQLTGQRLQTLPINIIHYSPLERTTETANIIAQSFPDVPLKPSPLLKECIPSVPKPFKHHFAQIPAEFLATRGLAQAREAYDIFFQPISLEEEDQYELIVAHGNLISYLSCRVLQAPVDSWLHINIQHCGICEVVIGPPMNIELRRHNDNGHLPTDLQTWT